VLAGVVEQEALARHEAPTPRTRARPIIDDTVLPEAAMYLRLYRGTADYFWRFLGDLEAEGLNWRPEAEAANSLFVLASHSFANIERNVLHHFAGRPYEWRREREFAGRGDSIEPLRKHWARLEPELRAVLDAATLDDLDREYDHPNMGRPTGREVLVRAVTHAREHVGHAGLTRDLWNATHAL